MHYLILFNPKSNRGKSNDTVKKCANKLKKNGHTVESGSLLDIKDVGAYLSNLDKAVKIIIIGGDGTLHYLANALMPFEVVNDLYIVRKAGTGNDFLRSIKKKEKGSLIRINDYIKDLPYELEASGKKRYFINSVGVGLDAYTCYLVGGSIQGKTQGSYLKSAYKAFKETKKHNITLTIDGVKKEHKNVWLTLIANSPYVGGGMKISPKSKREDDILEAVVVKDASKFVVFLILPSIYLGFHKIFKKYVKFYQGKHFILESELDNYIQYDGEPSYPMKRVEIYR